MDKEEVIRKIASIDSNFKMINPSWRSDRVGAVVDGRFTFSKDEIAWLKKQESPIRPNLKRSFSDWDIYDGTIKAAVSAYEQRISLNSSLAGYPGLDWRHVKSIIWTETGALSPSWKRRPMQIGANPSDKGMETVVMAKEHIKKIIPPERQAEFSINNITSDPKTNIQAGIAYLLSRLIKADATGKKLSWRAFDFATFAARYNLGDLHYSAKLAYCFAIIQLRESLL